MKWWVYPKYKSSGVAWFGDIPEHWDIEKLKHISSVQFSNVDKNTVESEEPVRLCNYVDVYYNEFITATLELMEATATQSEIQKFRLHEGDVLITKDSEAWDDIAVPAYVTGNHDRILCGYHLAQIRPNSERIDGKYLFRSFCSRGINDQFRVAATGITRYGLGKYWIDNGLFPVPPINEQRAIAAFLDRETARIDTLIEKKERQIELLQEKRSALISHAVTKGLDPNVKMKDSGIEWLGKIPEHWRLLSIKRLTLVKRGASPRPIDDPKYFDEEGEYAWVRIADVTASSRYLETTTQRLSELGKSLSVPLEPGDLFLSIAGTVGKPIITKIKCCIHDGFVYFPQYRENKEFLYYVFASGQPYHGLGKWGTQLNLNTNIVGGIHIGLPPEAEQDTIVAYLDQETARIDALIEKIRKSIDLLHEYRTALITAAVTGKIDVRKEVA
ncbi:MAG: restriction endonuclease subunit S [Deltaproteobacteria bacterium]|nr:MAG: restriction endonuclease subunit S [Deltaproteobacteria bacterium]